MSPAPGPAGTSPNPTGQMLQFVLMMGVMGVIGVVLSVKEKTLTIRSADTKLEIVKSAISEITERGNASSES